MSGVPFEQSHPCAQGPNGDVIQLGIEGSGGDGLRDMPLVNELGVPVREAVQIK